MSVATGKKIARAPKNRTLCIGETEKAELLAETLQLNSPAELEQITDKIIFQDFFSCVAFLPENFVDLLIVDPPYNINKIFAETKFKKRKNLAYEFFVDSWLRVLMPVLKKSASVYICCDWTSSAAVYNIARKYLHLRNRITWEREKGRAARKNWKNCAEDIWFGTVSKEYYFNLDAVKLRRRVLAPYRDAAGRPKDWQQSASGGFRLTAPSNLWTDITVPFWSMPENTDHPTQKPEKLLAKLILASSRPGEFILDPFAGSGSTCVTAKKLGRHFLGVEREADYCRLTVKRLRAAGTGQSIQGYAEGFFWERNSQPFPTQQT